MFKIRLELANQNEIEIQGEMIDDLNQMAQTILKTINGAKQLSTYAEPAAVEEYNGWPNYETWNVALWFSNDEGIYNLTRRIVKGAPGRAAAADSLRDLAEESDPTAERADFYADIMSHALRGRVDWFKSADSIAEEIEREW